jgi:hypothetical protein
MCFVWILDQMASFAVYSINWLLLEPRWRVFTLWYELDL